MSRKKKPLVIIRYYKILSTNNYKHFHNYRFPRIHIWTQITPFLTSSSFPKKKNGITPIPVITDISRVSTETVNTVTFRPPYFLIRINSSGGYTRLYAASLLLDRSTCSTSELTCAISSGLYSLPCYYSSTY